MIKLILSVFLFVCTMANMNSAYSQKSKTYLALGDSYTIGEAVNEQNSWPLLLVNKLAENDLQFEAPQIIAVTGWTTDELLKGIEDANIEDNTYDMVSLLIGVNNQYRGYNIQQYEEEFEILLQKAIKFAGGKAQNVFVVSIPDYGVTPFAKDNNKDPLKIERELKNYDAIAEAISKQYEVNFYDIRPISLKAVWSAQDYIAKDGLHPSAKMYQEWVNYFAAGVFQQLTDE